jgi:hypothetical protein
MIDDSNLRTWRIPPRRREADKLLLGEMAAISRLPQKVRRFHLPRLSLVGLVVGGLIVGGGVAAAVVSLQPQNPSVRDVARCYSQVSTDFSSSFPGTEVSIAQRLDPSTRATDSTDTDVPSQVVSLCAASWRLGWSRGGPGSAPASDDNPVPALVVCVLPSGEAAVFPGNETTCKSLGLPLMSAQGTPENETAP